MSSRDVSGKSIPCNKTVEIESRGLIFNYRNAHQARVVPRFGKSNIGQIRFTLTDSIQNSVPELIFNISGNGILLIAC